MERIDAETLIPGRGQPVAGGTVVMADGVIAYAGPTAGAPATPDARVTRAAAVMPGMWDCHGHFIGVRSANLRDAVTEPLATLGARTAADAAAALRAGFTSVREAGGVGIFLVRPIEEGTILGPTIYSAHAILSTTGGHGDIHELPLDWVHDAARSGGILRMCDGVPECLKAVREQLRLNARVIKVCASGGVMSQVDHPVHQQFSAEELRTIVEEAGRAERAVMAHCHGKPGILAALEAGVRTIEHGTYLDEEACEAMVEADAILVPTRFIVATLLVEGVRTGMAPYALRKLEAIADRHAAAVALAHEHGVRIALGTDIFMSGADLPVGWGHNARELPLLVAAGLSPLQALEAATANGPATLGPQAPRSGLLAEGYDADVITVSADPLQDVGVLAEPDGVTGVWKAGIPVPR